MSESKSPPGLAPRTRLPLRLSEQHGHRFWSAEVAPGRWVGCGPSIAVDRIGAWFVCTGPEEEQVPGHPATRCFGSFADLAVPDESCALDKWSWMCFTVRPIPINVDDDLLGFLTASGVYVTTDVALKAITEFEFGYVIMRNDKEGRRGGYARFFAVDHRGNRLWEMTGWPERFASATWRWALPWEDGNVFLFARGTILDAKTGEVLRRNTPIPGLERE